ncbi:MAG TPA: hypothetical protein VHV47_09320, partial [Opitutaceae bacterium]|nr:hypothetical protein [Opitutaceae bacterium]
MKGWTLPVLLAGLASAGPLGAGPDYRLVEPDAAEAASRLDARVRSFHVARAPVDAALLAVGRAYGFTFVADAPLVGEVSLEFRDGSLRELIDALAKTAGCYWELQGRVIALGRNVTRFYELDYPQMSRSSQGGSNVILSAQSGAGAGPGSAQGAGASVPSAAANQTDQT